MAKARSIKNIDAHAPTGRNARIIAKTRLEEMYSWDIYIDDPSNVHELHSLRIAAKRLRYTFEIFEETFSKAREPIMREITQIQEELGSIHDTDVMMALLRLCLSGHDHSVSGASGVSHKDTEKDKDLQEQEKSIVDPAMLASLLDPHNPPTNEEREGLQLLVHNLQQLREEQYIAFRQHWHQLREQGFQHKIMGLLDS